MCIVLQPVLPQSPCTGFRVNQGVICVADDSGDILAVIRARGLGFTASASIIR
jgi:hypothetical protein